MQRAALTADTSHRIRHLRFAIRANFQNIFRTQRRANTAALTGFGIKNNFKLFPQDSSTPFFCNMNPEPP